MLIMKIAKYETVERWSCLSYILYHIFLSEVDVDSDSAGYERSAHITLANVLQVQDITKLSKKTIPTLLSL